MAHAKLRSVTCENFQPWLEAVGEAELIGGWAEVKLEDGFVASIEAAQYQVFLTSYDPVLVFVQNRTERSFEIHACPVMKGPRPRTTHCGWRVVGRRAAG